MAVQTTAGRIRLGILTLPLSIVLIFVGFLVQSSVADPNADLSRSQAEQITSNSYTLGSLSFGIGSLLMVFGLFSLYAYLANSRVERLALVAMALSVVGAASGVGFVGVDTVMQVAGELYLAGERGVLEQYSQTIMFPGDIFLTIFNRGVRLVGFILFGIAIWRSGTLPKGAAILWISSEIVFPVERVLGVGTYLFGGALLIVASCWIAWTIWRQPNAEIVGACFVICLLRRH